MFSLHEGVFSPLFNRQSIFACCAGGLDIAAPSSFSPAEKVKRKRISALRASLRSVALRNAPAGAAAGVEEKEGFARSVYPATPTGAVRLFVKHCFSCGLCPKDAAAGRSCVSILWHLSGRIQYLPHPLAAAALMQKHIRKHFQIAPRPLIKTYLFAAALSVAKLLPALFFFVPCTCARRRVSERNRAQRGS